MHLHVAVVPPTSTKQRPEHWFEQSASARLLPQAARLPEVHGKARALVPAIKKSVLKKIVGKCIVSSFLEEFRRDVGDK
jgi:hypothetical protein